MNVQSGEPDDIRKRECERKTGTGSVWNSTIAWDMPGGAIILRKWLLSRSRLAGERGPHRNVLFPFHHLPDYSNLATDPYGVYKILGVQLSDDFFQVHFAPCVA
jgi:hypothetical protein